MTVSNVVSAQGRQDQKQIELNASKINLASEKEVFAK